MLRSDTDGASGMPFGLRAASVFSLPLLRFSAANQGRIAIRSHSVRLP